MRKISILGSTGSIGVQSLQVIKDLPDFMVVGLTTNKNIELLIEQILEFKPIKVAIMDEECYEIARKLISKLDINYNIEVLQGLSGIIEVATIKEADLVLNSLVGNIGLSPTLNAISAGKNIALANKETLVTSGELVMEEAKKYNVKIYPIDSEHSAIFQCLQGNSQNKIEKLYLTASGGPFRNKDIDYIENSTLKEALKHPNWKMGNKITIDSATMMNKGFEVIEAKWFFDVSLENIKVLVHPQSIIHSMVQFEDGALIAQLGEPDMKLSIAYSLTYPNRIKNNYPRLDFEKRNTFTFEQPDFIKFRCLQLVYDAMRIGGTMPTVLNGANEVAVSKFLNGKIKFTDIAKIIENTMCAYTVKYKLNLDTILEADSWSRDYANEIS
jgi:1-deoxy-D-xylulose-5-phosphate reductoisomerase